MNLCIFIAFLYVFINLLSTHSFFAKEVFIHFLLKRLSKARFPLLYFIPGALLEPSWRPLGDLLEISWRPLGDLLETSWRPLGALLKAS
jgi:hypothetical protein